MVRNVLLWAGQCHFGYTMWRHLFSQRILLHLSWNFMLFFNAIPELQNVKYSNWKSMYYRNRKTHSGNIEFTNVLEVS